jgi:hypothetical protein
MCLACIENPLPVLDGLEKIIERLKKEGKDQLRRRARQFQAKRIKEFYSMIGDTTACFKGMDIRKAIDEKRYEISREI